MQEYKTLPELLYFIKENRQRPDLLNYRRDNSWKALSTLEFVREAENFALGLSSLGVKKGEFVGLIAASSPFWVISDLAITLIGGVTVPIFNRISPENLEFEIEDSRINLVIIGDSKEYEPVRMYGGRVKKIVTLGFKKDDKTAVAFEDVLTAGTRMREKDPGITSKLFAKPDENALFTVIYTSGSMGRPKGVMLNHRNIITQIEAAAQIFSMHTEQDRAVSSLPLAHIFERMVIYFYLSRGIPVYFVDDLNNIGALVRDVRPTIMTVVPRLLEKIHEKMKSSAAEYKGIKKAIAMAAFRRAETRDIFDRPTFMDFVFKRLVYSKLFEALGGNFRYVISGAAALPYDIGRFFINIGLTIYEGYGMTEASPVIAANNLKYHKLGTVGQPYPSVTVKIAPDGEILAKGPNVMMGYLNNKEETAKTIDGEGFLHTGDLGEIDSEGYLVIKGRKKELFKKSTGEYVPPVPIESALRKLNIVDNAVVIAEGRKFVACLIFPNFEEAEKLKNSNGLSGMTMDEFLESSFINKMIDDHIHEMNRHLHHTEEVQRFRIIKKPISIETGELTPTMKMRREIIETRFKKEIDEMYAG